MKSKRTTKPEPTKPKAINVENEAKCIIARHGTPAVQDASFAYIVSLTSESLDLPTREEIARTVHKMAGYAGTWEEWLDNRMRAGHLWVK